MNPRTTGPRFAHFARSALMFAMVLPVAFTSLQGCAAGEVNPTGDAGKGGEAGSGGSGQTGGMAGMGGSSSSSSSSSTASSSSSGTGGAGAGFVPPMGTADYPSEAESNDIPALANPFGLTTKGFTASIYPMGDIDVFEVDVTVPGSQLAVAISDGMGGCPMGLSAALRVDGPSGFIGADAGICPKLSSVNTAGLADLSAGKHYVQVESSSFAVEPFYIVEISLQLPVCGDGNRSGPEQCDDGNTNSSDGCTTDCKLEGTFINEVEPNQPAANANSLNGTDGVVASIQPVGDQDFFSFDVTVPGSLVTLEVGDGLLGCPPGFDSILKLFSPSGTLFVTADDGGVGSCSRISPALYAEVSDLPVGKYTASVEELLNDNVEDLYVLKIKIAAPSCGDGFVQLAEECDDGNTTSADGCSAMCKLEGNYSSETEPNDTLVTANASTGFDGVFGAIQPVGDRDFFSFDVTVPGSSVRVETTNGSAGCPTGFNSVLSLFGDNNQLLVTDDDDGPGACSLISPQLDAQATNLPVGNYKVRVEESLNDATQASYVLKIRVLPPGCGDYLRIDPEQCDDGNTISGDGCSATCVAESPWEIEPNATQMTATALWAGTNRFNGSILPVGDIDYFSFILPTGKKPVLETHDIDNALGCGGDTEITLYDSVGTMIVTNDDDGTNACSLINNTLYPAVNNLPPGTYYVRVNDIMNDGVIASYQLDVKFQ